MYDFDTVLSREGMGAEKWERCKTTDGMHAIGVMPFSVADMEFRCAPEIKAALQKTLDLGILGYVVETDECKEAVCQWMKARHDWDIDADWIVPTYGVVSALYSAVRAFTKPGEGIIIQTPVYPPFAGAAKANARRIEDCPLIERDGRYEMDFDALEAAAKKSDVTLAILCSPHNPVGRVWSADELKRYAKIMERNNVTVLSDEIHFDLILKGGTHTVYPKAACNDNWIMCTSPSKTFNLAGLTTSNVIISDEELRSTFTQQYRADTSGHISVFGVPACEAAYRFGAKWLDELLEYVEGNMDECIAFFKRVMPSVKIRKPEGTYLLWADFTEAGLTEDELDVLLYDESLFFVGDGRPFGEGGALHRRINVACPKSALKDALCRLEAALARS